MRLKPYEPQVVSAHRRDRLRGWGGRTRTAESVGIKIRFNGRDNFRRFGQNGKAETVRLRAARWRICSCMQGFRQMLTARRFVQLSGRAVQYAWAPDSNRKRAKKTILPVSVILHSTLPLNRACMVVTDAEPDRLAPLPRQRRQASAGFGWWQRDGALAPLRGV